MAEKHLILVVETTAAMGPYWNTLRTDYLEKIIRCFGENESTEQKQLSVSNSEFALVTYNTHGCYSGCLVQRTGWTRDPDVFCNWLSALPFTGGGFNDGAIAEGLAEALVMFPNSQSGGTNQQNVNMHRHCILVAASNPYPLQTPVYIPRLPNPEQSETVDSDPGNRLYDAEAVAKAFTHFSISLSVICPRQLPKVKAVYNAGNQNNRAADPPADVKTTHSLVLISESFKEALGALSRCGITNLPSNQRPVKVDVSVTPVTGAPPTSMPSVNGSIVNRQQILAGNVTPTTVKWVGQNSNLGSLTSATSNFSSSSNIGISQPLANLQGAVSMRQQVSSTSTGNLSGTQTVQCGVNKNQNVMTSLGPTVPSSGTGTTVLTPRMPQQVQSGMQPLVNNAVASIPLPQQTTCGMQSSPSKYLKVWEGGLFVRKDGLPVFLNKLVGYRNSSASETLAANWPAVMYIIRLIPHYYMTDKYVLICTFSLVLYTFSLVIYIGVIRYVLLFPFCFVAVLILKGYIRQYAGKADLLTFQAMNPHRFLHLMQETKLCAVIQLPSQTLLLSGSDKAFGLIGMLFPADMVVYEPQLSS